MVIFISNDALSLEILVAKTKTVGRYVARNSKLSRNAIVIHRALQCLNRVWVLVIWLVIFCFLEGFAINGIANAGLPAIERQFQLTSSKSSLIPASQDIGALIIILFVSFIGGLYNKAACIAVGSVIMAVGSFVFTIPHIAETYAYEIEGKS